MNWLAHPAASRERETVCTMVAVLTLLCASAARAQGTALEQSSTANRMARLLNIDECKPSYPTRSRLAGESGSVRLRVHVAANGQFVGVSLIGSSGFAHLDQATIRAISSCRFAAGMKAGEPVDSSVVVEYLWKLEEPLVGPPLDCDQQYPEASLRAKEHGKTTLRFRLDAAGKAEKIEVSRSSGSVLLDEASMSALRRCRFELTPKQATAIAAKDITVLFLWLLPDSRFPLGNIGPFVTNP
jgi:periplasmic protein TonB